MVDAITYTTFKKNLKKLKEFPISAYRYESSTSPELTDPKDDNRLTADGKERSIALVMDSSIDITNNIFSHTHNTENHSF